MLRYVVHYCDHHFLCICLLLQFNIIAFYSVHKQAKHLYVRFPQRRLCCSLLSLFIVFSYNASAHSAVSHMSCSCGHSPKINAQSYAQAVHDRCRYKSCAGRRAYCTVTSCQMHYLRVQAHHGTKISVNMSQKTRCSAVAERPRDASCLSVVSFSIPTAQFLPRDAMHKRGICRHAVSVYPSVCPSVCHVRELRQNE